MSTIAQIEGGTTVIDNDTQTITYEMKSPALILAEARGTVALADDLVIDSDSMYQEGAEILSKIVGSKKTLDEKRLASGAPLRTRLNTINDGYKPAIDLLADGETSLKLVMAKYVDDKEIERKRLQKIADDAAEAQRKETERLAKKAREKAEAEAKKARDAAQAEADQRTAEANEKAEAARKEAAAALLAGDAEKAQELTAKADQTVATAAVTANMIIAHGDQSANDALEFGAAEADAHVATSQMLSPAVVQMARPRATGASAGKKYTGEVTDAKLLLKFVLDNFEHFSHFVEFDQGAINRYASDQKDRMNVPGVALRSETKIASRRA